MKLKIFIILFAVIAMSGCKKTIDLNSDSYFGVQEFVKSKNAKSKCGEKAECEGKTIKLQGILDPNNINRETSAFFLIDQDKEKYTISVAVDSSITTEVFDKLKNKGGSFIKIEGVAEGFDMNYNFSCERGMVIKIDKASKVLM